MYNIRQLFLRALLLFVITIVLSQRCISESSDFVSQIVETVEKSKNYTFPNNNDAYFEPKDMSNKPTDFGSYDFIIVGGGAAGGVLANRLTEGKFSVLMIEAGKKDPAAASVLGLSQVLYQSEWNWGYKTVPQKHACLAFIDKRCFFPRGKGLGGSSIINAGMYVRGHPKDYDKWAEMGNIGWSYNDCLPYFKKSEKAEFTVDIDKEYHGFNGPQSINIVDDIPNLTPSLLEAFKEIGLKERDYNGASQYGVSRMQFYLDYNIRSSTTHAFIGPAVNRTNLKITLQSLVTKIRIENRIANGVEFMKHGKKYFAFAKKEVIVSAGAINSPQVLMLSGIGPAEELKKHGIEVIADLPVGKYLYDHLIFPINYRTNITLFNNSLMENLDLWKEAKRPLNAGFNAQLVGFWNTKGRSNSPPDIGIYAMQTTNFASQLLFREEYIEAFKEVNAQKDISLRVLLLHPKSFGSVKLQSKDPKHFPLIDPQYFSDPSDLEQLYQGIQIILQLNNTEQLKKENIKVMINSYPSCDGKYEKLTKKWWYCALEHVSSTLFHPIGTTRMGVDPKTSVVNPELKVHKIKRLRVVDAGVIPSQTSGHTNAPVVMIAEKIADVIKREHSK